MRKTTGYFFVASKCGGLRSQYCTGVPPAPATVRLAGFGRSSADSHAAFSLVSRRGVPSLFNRYRSAGATSDDMVNTANSLVGWNAPTAPPWTASFGVPPAAGIV